MPCCTWTEDIEEPAEYALKWDAETAGWTIVGDAEEYRMSEERKEILGVLIEAGEFLAPARSPMCSASPATPSSNGSGAWHRTGR